MKTIPIVERREPRIAAQHKLFLRVIKSPDDRLVGSSLKCRSVNYSTHGMKLLILDEWIRSESVVEMAMLVFQPKRGFNLTGVVRWHTPENEGCSIGLTILEEADFETWAEYVHTRLAQEA